MNEKDQELSDLLAEGRRLFEAGSYEKAEEILRQCVARGACFADVYNMLGIVYHQQGRLVDARNAFEKALEVNPNYVEASLHLSVTLADLGLSSEAEDLMESVASKAADKGGLLDPVSKARIANMHAELAAAYASGSCLDEALEEYEKALKLCPQFVDLRTRKAVVLREMGRLDQAEAELEAVRREKPDYLEAGIQLGLTLLVKGAREEAIRLWEDILDVQPGNKRARMYLDLVRSGSKSRGG